MCRHGEIACVVIGSCVLTGISECLISCGILGYANLLGFPSTATPGNQCVLIAIGRDAPLALRAMTRSGRIALMSVFSGKINDSDHFKRRSVGAC